MVRILFVDDEPRVLDGLRRSMRSMRDEWEMRFCVSGAEALAELAIWQADLIVTDLQMPGMSGVQLLREVKSLHPAMIRFVLSGHASASAVVQAASMAHQYLSKPCEAEVLKAAINRARALRATLSDSEIAVWAGTVGVLPSLPAAFQRITVCLQDTNASITDVADVIKNDLAVSAMILKLANSAFFGSGQTIRTIERGVSYLGVDIVASLVLVSGALNTPVPPTLGFDVASLWKHSLQTAAIARDLASVEGWPAARADDAFLAGMLHDLGHLVIAAASAGEGALMPNAAVDHAAVGAYLVGLWGFPDDLVEAIAFHHHPSRAASAEISLAALVHAANLLAHRDEMHLSEQAVLDMDKEFFNRDGMSERWQIWQRRANAGCSSSGAGA